MRRNLRKTSIAALVSAGIVALVALSALSTMTGCDSDSAVLTTPLEGTWSSGCLPSAAQHFGVWYVWLDGVTDTWTFSQFGFTRTQTYYSASGSNWCGSAFSQITMAGSFAPAGSLGTLGGAYNVYIITMSYSSILGEAVTTTAASDFNSDFGGAGGAFCGLNWVAGQTYDISGSICSNGPNPDGVAGNIVGNPGYPKLNTTTYFTYIIDDNTLQFGNTWSVNQSNLSLNPGGNYYTLNLPQPQ